MAISWPAAPDTNAVLDACKSAMEGVTFNYTDGSKDLGGNYIITQRTLQRVTKGGLKDYTESTPLGVIRLFQGPTERHNFGGRVRNRLLVHLRFALSMIDAEAAEVNLAYFNDAFPPYFLQHATLSGAHGVFNSRLDQESIRMGYVEVQRQEYRVLEMLLEVNQEYQIPGGIIG
ncbi:MAG: hypothetical protein J2P36_39170 [Ktedonobacteraceae bacterium]|nr:hypothetical protein [Ktedonobacteraceae bacterium]